MNAWSTLNLNDKNRKTSCTKPPHPLCKLNSYTNSDRASLPVSPRAWVSPEVWEPKLVPLPVSVSQQWLLLHPVNSYRHFQNSRRRSVSLFLLCILCLCPYLCLNSWLLAHSATRFCTWGFFSYQALHLYLSALITPRFLPKGGF